MPCSRCGECCKKMWLPYNKTELRTKKQDADVAFVLKHWVQLSRLGKLKGAWFDCRLLDPKTKLCREWSTRPRLCRDYPRYDGTVFANLFRLKVNCGFRDEVPF